MPEFTNDPTEKVDEPPRHPARAAQDGAAQAPASRPGGSFPQREADADVEAIHEPIMREKTEPADGYEPIPTSLIFVFFGLIAWGGWYLGTYSGGWNSMVYDEAPGAAMAPVEEAKAIDPMVLGRRVFVRCQACHQSNGAGVAGTYPPLAGSDWLQGPAPTPARIVLNGLHGPIEVEGATFNNEMPGWRAQLSDEEIAAVLTYARGSWGNAGTPVEPGLVAAVRELTAAREAAWTAPELEAEAREDEASGRLAAAAAPSPDEPAVPAP